MSILPDDVLEMILFRLPVFDLVRCKGVCKAWRSFISSADFVAAHLQRSKSDPSTHHLLVHNRSFDLRQPVTGPFASFTCFSSKDLFIVGSANGLICIAGRGDVPCRTPSSDDIWIFNPVTGLSKKLPYLYRNAFDTRQNIKFAFWCDEDDDGVYKLVRFLSNPNGDTMLELWVSTSPDTWTVVSTFDFDFHFHRRRYHACDALIEGRAAYWIVVCCEHEFHYESDDETGIDDDEIVVVSLDLKTLALSKFSLFSNGELDMRNSYLWDARRGEPNSILFGGNLNGEFVLVAYNFSTRGEVYDIWTPVMDDTGAALLIKKLTICLDAFPFEKCLGIVNDKLVLTHCNGMLVALYDPLTGMLEVLKTDLKLETLNLASACGFVGSLVSIDGFGFESSDLLSKNMAISWPYSVYHPAINRKEGWRKNRKNQRSRKEGWRKNCKKQRRR